MKMEIEDFADKHQLIMEIRGRTPGTAKVVPKYYAFFRDLWIRKGGLLVGNSGIGDTPEDAIADYAGKISDQILAINPGKDEIRIKAPRLFYKQEQGENTENTYKYSKEPNRLEQVEKDPWAHRSKNMTCQTCMYFVVKALLGVPVNTTPTIGRCRRHAPTLQGFPAVFPNDWCGDHKTDEEKLGNP